MIKFLTTQGLNYYLEKLLIEAEVKIIIISPYVQLQRRIKDFLREKKQQGLEIIIVCRINELKEPLSEYATNIIDVPSLHAKCYLNEKMAILTSLNLYEFSQQNNDEMGIFVKNVNDGKILYHDMKSEAERLYKNKTSSFQSTNINRNGQYQESHKIISVKIVKGSSLKANWKSPMQVIVTNKGEFIDNMPGKDFRFNSTASCGYAWSSEVGKVVNKIKTISNSGYKWLNKRS